MKHLALLGGPRVSDEKGPDELLRWPIITEEDEAAILDVVRRNAFSKTDITEKFQEEFAKWIGAKHAVCYCNGTCALFAAMFAVGLGAGDEIICPTKTYWASISQAVNLGATAVFCNIKEDLCMDPADLERCITPRTKAIMVVHYLGVPCDMDAIMAIARRHGVKVIEDVSHAQGSFYKGKRLGTFGDVAAMSLMSQKTFAAGELGILVTSERRYYERALAFAHYEKNNERYITESEELKPYFNIALGGVKGRANQVCTAMARVQLKYYDERCEKTREAMNYFWDQLEGLPGIRPIRADERDGTKQLCWYCPQGAYHPEELHGLPVTTFCKAVAAEIPDLKMKSGANYCLHTHEFFRTFDLMHIGKPSRIAFDPVDMRTEDAKCDPSLARLCFSVPTFRVPIKEWIDVYAEAFKKVVRYHEELLELEGGDQEGRWFGTERD